jgi:hypothetical protein
MSPCAGLAAETAVSLAACRYFSAVGTASGQVWTFGGGFNGELGGGASWSSAARPLEGLLAEVRIVLRLCCFCPQRQLSVAKRSTHAFGGPVGGDAEKHCFRSFLPKTYHGLTFRTPGGAPAGGGGETPTSYFLFLPSLSQHLLHVFEAKGPPQLGPKLLQPTRHLAPDCCSCLLCHR